MIRRVSSGEKGNFTLSAARKWVYTLCREKIKRGNII